ncbi:MAG: TolC family protein [Acidobacteria bacterium]|nr:TolC family protein [Acidobacteriota bacterium]
MRCAPLRFALLVGAIVLGGCASVPPDSGFGDVHQAVADQTGQSIAWNPKEPVGSPASDDAILPLLKDELTADRAVQIALTNNRDLLATIEQLGIARADFLAASTIRNPILDGEIRFPGGVEYPFELGLTQSLIDLLQLRTRRAVGAAAFEAAKSRVTGAVVNFAGEVRIDYFDVQASRQILARQRIIAEAARLSVEIAMRQHTAGNISDLDLESEQALYEQAKLDLARVELSALKARERLIIDLGLLDAAAELELPNGFDQLPENEPQLEDLEATAIERRIDVRLARQELEVASLALPAAARSEVLEELSLGVHHEREPEGSSNTGPALEIPIPIFNRGAARRERAIATMRAAQQRLAALTVNARSEVRIAREELVEARARAEYLRDVVVPRRQRILYLTQLEYNAMLRGVYQLIEAKQSEASAQHDYVVAQRDYWVARTGLDAAMSGVSAFAVRDEGRDAAGSGLFIGANRSESKENH